LDPVNDGAPSQTTGVALARPLPLEWPQPGANKHCPSRLDEHLPPIPQRERWAGNIPVFHPTDAMPFLSPVGGGGDADEFYFGYDAGYHRSSGGKSAKKEKGFLSCLPCFCKPLGLGLSWFFNRFAPGALFSSSWILFLSSIRPLCFLNGILIRVVAFPHPHGRQPPERWTR
jgi:hypothetical protein